MSEPQQKTDVFDIEAYEKIAPVARIDSKYGPLAFHIPNKVALWRVNTLFTKEPDTIKWIEGFKEGELLFDIGANMGIYSILAAIQKVKVKAFEPEAENVRLLQRNIVENRVIDLVTAWPLAISDESKLDVLYLSQFGPAGSCHSFGESVDFRMQKAERPLQLGAVSTTIDELIGKYGIKVPDHIKIDVDGIEHKVLKGGDKTLADKKLRSVLVELNWDIREHQEMVPYMESFGFTYDPEQVAENKTENGPFQNTDNYIFYREV